MDMEKTVMCCPNCKKLVEAADHMRNHAIVGFLESVLPTINCKCGYKSLPIKMTVKEYIEWKKSNKEGF